MVSSNFVSIVTNVRFWCGICGRQTRVLAGDLKLGSSHRFSFSERGAVSGNRDLVAISFSENSEVSRYSLW